MEPPVDLTIPEPGSTTTRRILGAYLKRCLSDYLRLPVGRFHSQVADDFGALRGLVERLSRGGQAGLVFSLMRRAEVSTLLRCLDAELWARGDVAKLDAWLAELNALVALELARAGALPEGGVRLRRSPPHLVSPALGVALSLPPECVLGFAPERLTIELGPLAADVPLRELPHADLSRIPGASVSRPYPAIAGDLSLALVDSNPLADVEAHPDKQGNAIDLGEHPVEEWVSALGAALALVERTLPALADEIRLVMQLVVPVGFHAERHLSASYAEAIGVAYLSLHPDPMTMAEALVHEFSHNKLNALGRLDPVLENAHSPLFASPVRPDPRPLWGVLLAVHAFTPVARLYELMLDAHDPLSESPTFARRYRQIAAGNHEAVQTLADHARPTPAGRTLLDELQRWDDHFAPVRAGA